MLLKVLVYGYATGVFSSRQIAKKAEEDVAFRVLSANNFPNFRTVNRFRKLLRGIAQRVIFKSSKGARYWASFRLGARVSSLRVKSTKS